MTKWMSDHKLPLIVAVVMFAFMAMFMGEFLILDNGSSGMSGLAAITGELPPTCLWIWRIGGFVTWPVFMYLMLRPHIASALIGDPRLGSQANSTVSIACVIAALYGGFGLWLVSWLTTNMISLLESADEFLVLTPILALLVLVLPFAYVWGFVGIYGFARTKLKGTENDRSWVGPSIGGAILGVFGIGILIYIAIAIVMIPIVMIMVSVSSSTVSQHLSIDLLAMAISTGNFASQWLGFKKVDEKLDPARYGKPAPRIAQPLPYGTAPMAYPYNQQQIPNSPYAAAPTQMPYGASPSQQPVSNGYPYPYAPGLGNAQPYAFPTPQAMPSVQPPSAQMPQTPSATYPPYAPAMPTLAQEPQAVPPREEMYSQAPSPEQVEPEKEYVFSFLDDDFPLADTDEGEGDTSRRGFPSEEARRTSGEAVAEGIDIRFLPDGRLILPDGSIYEPSARENPS